MKRLEGNILKPTTNWFQPGACPSFVRERDLHEHREEPRDDYARPKASPTCPPRGCDARPDGAGQYYAHSPRHYWLARSVPTRAAKPEPLLAMSNPSPPPGP